MDVFGIWSVEVSWRLDGINLSYLSETKGDYSHILRVTNVPNDKRDVQDCKKFKGNYSVWG